MQKIRNILRAVSEKTALTTNNTDLVGPRWRRSKKIHHYTIKICRLKIWKKRSTLDGNLNVCYICQNKAMNFLQILFKRQRLIVVLVLVILYYFEAACLIIFRFL